MALSSFAFKTLVKLTGKNLLLPFYHVVSDKNPAHINQLYPVKTVKQFETELDFLLKYFTPIGVTELTGKPKNKKAFLLSFDDGLAEMYHIVFPILKRKGVPALFFLNPAFVDNRDLFYRYKASLLANEFLKNNTNIPVNLISRNISTAHAAVKEILSVTWRNREMLDNIALQTGYSFTRFQETQQPYLTTNQIKEMAAEGFHFGGHSVDHPVFSELTLEEQLLQANESIHYVTSLLGNAHRYFSFPFFDSGVKTAFFEKLMHPENPDKPELVFGSSGLKTDEIPFVYQRLNMEKATSNGKNFIFKEYSKYLLKLAAGKTLHKHSR